MAIDVMFMIFTLYLCPEAWDHKSYTIGLM